MVSCVVGAVGALTVMRVLLFLCEMSMSGECEVDGNAGVGAGGGLFTVSAECIWYMGGIPGSGVWGWGCRRRARDGCGKWGERCRCSV